MTDFTYYVDRIRDGHHFTLTRWGDGEWATVLGIEGMNCDGNTYFPDMGDRLKETLLKPHPYPYHYGLVKIAREVYSSEIDFFCLKNNVQITWADGTVFVDAVRSARLYKLIQVLIDKKIVYVGPSTIRSLSAIDIDYATFIDVPMIDAWLQYYVILQMVEVAIENHNPDILGVSAGMLTEVLLYDLYDKFGDSLTMIDFGSLWDGFLGRKTRSYMRTDAWSRNRSLNLGLR